VVGGGKHGGVYEVEAESSTDRSIKGKLSIEEHDFEIDTGGGDFNRVCGSWPRSIR
jgi:hypothetical protein